MAALVHEFISPGWYGSRLLEAAQLKTWPQRTGFADRLMRPMQYLGSGRKAFEDISSASRLAAALPALDRTDRLSPGELIALFSCFSQHVAVRTSAMSQVLSRMHREQSSPVGYGKAACML